MTVAVLLALVLVRVAFLVHALSDLPESGGSGLGNNVRRYHDITELDGMPYRDFAVENPPLALALIDALGGETARELALRLGVAMLLCELGVAVALWLGWSRRTAFRYLLIGTPLAFHGYLRFDLASVVLAVAGVALLRHRRLVGGAITLVVGAFVKVWPGLLLPSITSRPRRTLLAAAVSAIVGLAAWVAWAGPDAPVQVATFRGATGWEFQTPWGLILWKVQGMPLRFESGALRVGTVDPSIRIALAATFFAVLLWTSWRTRRSPSLADGYGATAVVGTLLLTSTLFSDQFVAWLIPWVAAADDERATIWSVIATVTTAGAVALTGSDDLPNSSAVVASLLALRNVAVLVVTAVAILAIRGAPRESWSEESGA